MLNENKTVKKYFKMLTQIRGMKKLEESVLPNNYKHLWCAGKSVELIDEVLSCEEIIERIKSEYNEKLKEMKGWI